MPGNNHSLHNNTGEIVANYYKIYSYEIGSTDTRSYLDIAPRGTLESLASERAQ